MNETEGKVLTRYKKYKKSYQAYYQANKERISNYYRNWRKSHLGRMSEHSKRWHKKNPEKRNAQLLITHHPQKYPLTDRCDFCGATEKLEHGHIDYNYPELYLTVCRRCNIWMDREKTELAEEKKHES